MLGQGRRHRDLRGQGRLRLGKCVINIMQSYRHNGLNREPSSLELSQAGISKLGLLCGLHLVPVGEENFCWRVTWTLELGL